MSLFSLEYLGFVGILLLLYYLLPRLGGTFAPHAAGSSRNSSISQDLAPAATSDASPAVAAASAHLQWRILLIGSLIFYALNGPGNLIFILLTALSVFLGSLQMERITMSFREAKKDFSVTRDQRKILKAQALRKKRMILTLVLVLNFGILAWLKYWNELFHASSGLLLPLGISFYTFQSLSYLIDIYNDKVPAERSFARFLLFVSWFPQLLQGPINRYDRMQALYEPHAFDLRRTGRALWLILFGLMKKYAVADMLVTHIASLLDVPLEDVPGSVIVFAILLYSAQQYADFSGGIDIVLGVSLLFGIPMMENFKRPYFSTSLGDFWRRWHISLGAWMRDYLFYPFALLKPMQRFGHWCTKHLGRHFGRVLPAAVSNIVVFFVVGLWHGAAWHYILWGLYNGVVIALSDLTAPVWSSLSQKLHLKTESRGFHVFRIVRTFIIVNIGWYFDRITDRQAVGLAFRNTLLRFHAGRLLPQLHGMLLGNGDSLANVGGSFLIAAIGIVIIFVVSFRQECGIDVTERILHATLPVQTLLAFCLILLVLASFLFTQTAGGFLYANF